MLSRIGLLKVFASLKAASPHGSQFTGLLRC
jgi:hypothetical protein